MPLEETLDRMLGAVTPSDDEVIHAHLSSRSSSPVIGHRDHKPKRRKHNVSDDALPQESTTSQPKIDATEPAARTGGAHRCQRRAPAAAKRTEAGCGSSNKDDDKVSSSVAVAPPASSRFVCLKHSSSSVVIGGGSSSEQHLAAGGSSGGSNSPYYANNHAAASSSSSPRPTREPAAAPSSHLPKVRRPPSAFATSGIVPGEPDEDDAEYFRLGVAAFGSLDFAAQLAEVKKFTGVGQQPQALAEGGSFSFWLTPQQVDDDLAYVYGEVTAQRERRLPDAGNVMSSCVKSPDP